MMNIAVIGVVGIIAWVWASYGFFSSLLHFISVVVAGALAFASWEAAVYFGLNRVEQLADMQWGITLMLLFTVYLVILKTVTNKACPGNIDFSVLVNLIGGGVLGALSGVISAGIILIGVNFIQGPSELLGYRGWIVDSTGNITRDQKLWLPADEWTYWFYSTASLGPFSVPNPVAEWHPQLAQQADLYRESYDNGASRMGMTLGDYSVSRVIRLDEQLDPEQIADFRGIADPETGRPPTVGERYVIRTILNNSTWDDGGKLRLTKAQVRLVVRTPGGEMKPVHPHAFYQQFLTESNAEYRFVYDAGDVAASSVGSPSETKLAFEFLVPPGAVPHHLIIRQARPSNDLPTGNDVELLSAEEVLAQALTGTL